MNNKHKITLPTGIITALIGVIIRLNANEIAWPLEYGYSGERENTVWAIKEQALQDVSLFLMGLGCLIVLIVVANWLWMTDKTK